MTDTALSTEVNLRSLKPQDVKQLAWFCNQAAASGLFRTSAGGNSTRAISGGEAFLLASQGVELGLSPLQSLRELNIINGRVDIPASVRAALIAASPKVTEWDVDADDTFCTIKAKRRDRTNGVTVTVRAEDLPSADRNRHQSHMEDWLYARAVRRISRQYFPDLNLGMETDSYPMEQLVEARVERVVEAEKAAGTDDGAYGFHDECGGALSLHTNTRTGGAFLLCDKCNATFPPPQAIRDAMRRPEPVVDPEPLRPAANVHWDEAQGRWIEAGFNDEPDGVTSEIQEPTETHTLPDDGAAGDVAPATPPADDADVPPAAPEGPQRINPDDVPF